MLKQGTTNVGLFLLGGQGSDDGERRNLLKLG